MIIRIRHELGQIAGQSKCKKIRVRGQRSRVKIGTSCLIEFYDQSVLLLTSYVRHI